MEGDKGRREQTSMGNSPEDLRQTIRAKTDEELYLLLRVHSQNYTLQALTVASEEFRRRQLDEPTMSRIMAVADKALDEKSGKQESMSDAKETGRALGSIVRLCIVIVFVGYAIYGGYEWLDSIGWISHQEETVISARSDWLVGESKECSSATLNSDGAAPTGKEVGYAMSSVSCDDGPEHKMEVTFYGQKVQADYKLVSWRCTRNVLSFTCYQTGGER